MKRILFIATFGLCVLLVVFSKPVMNTAQDALQLWWSIVLPTLFPFFVCATLAERTGILNTLAMFFRPLSKILHISQYALPVLLLSGLSGYPSGARLCGMLWERKEISADEAQRLGTVCNLCSPMFIMGALCIGMLKTADPFPLLCIAHYLSAIFLAIILQICKPIPHKYAALTTSRTLSLPQALPGALGDGMLGLIKVGGSIVFFLVIAEILKQTHILSILCLPFRFLPHSDCVQGIICGMLEMTGGCHVLSQTELPLRLSVALCAFLISFGGLCVMVQAMAFLEYPHPGAYFRAKLLQGALAGVIAWFLFPVMPGETAAMATPILPYTQNMFSGAAILFTSALGAASVWLFSLAIRKRLLWKANDR